MSTAKYYVQDCLRMVEAAPSKYASSSKSHIHVNGLVADVSVSRASDREKMHPIDLRPVPPDNSEED